jgi:hypothetical protein
MLPPFIKVSDETPRVVVDHYWWASCLFDYVAAWTPQQAYLPNVDPESVDPGLSHAEGDVARKYPPSGGVWPAAGAPEPVAIVSRATDDTAATEGLINVNTARSSSAVPDNLRMWREVGFHFKDSLNDINLPPHGPFKNLFELNTTPGFLGGGGSGDFSPLQGTLLRKADGRPVVDTREGVPSSFAGSYGSVIEQSNQFTTRSDSFTVYILLQGWRNVGSATPELVVQRRAAAIIDRSTVKPLLDSNLRETGYTPMSVIRVPN